jgi:aminoglycoside 6-adenylyltransferase
LRARARIGPASAAGTGEGGVVKTQREDPVTEELIELGKRSDEIRAVILTSSRAAGRCDLLSDYDAELYVTDVARFAERDDWFEAFGPVLVMLRLEREGGPGCTRLVQYEDGSRIDFQVAPVEALKEICAAPVLPEGFDIGYEVLLDKDGITASLRPPTFRAFIPAPPSAAEYASVVNGFWWNSPYVSKSLWRGEVLAAASWLDGLRQYSLREMLEWSVELERNWSWKTGIRGKGLDEALDPETQGELAAACGGGGIEELWEALFAAISLFRKTAVGVAESLGYEYPHDLDARVTAYHQTIRKLDRGLTCREELARLLKESYERPTP